MCQTSSLHNLLNSVPQGSVLGPLLFILNLTGIDPLITKHRVRYKLVYADNILLYLICPPRDLDQMVSRLESCVSELRQWLTSKFLVLNADKTEFLLVGSAAHLRQQPQRSIRVGSTLITSKTFVRYLGVELDQVLSMDK